MNKRQQRLVNSIAGLAVSGGIIGLLISQLDTGKAVERLGQADSMLISLASVFSIFLLLARGLRFRLLTLHADYVVSTSALGLQNLLIRIMPFRLGELSLPYVLSKKANEPASRTVISLLLVRLLDLWTFLAIGMITIITFIEGGELKILGLILLIFFVASVALFRFAIWLRIAFMVGKKIAKLTWIGNYKIVKRGFDNVEKILEENKQLNIQLRLFLSLSTIAIIILHYIMLGTLAVAFGLDLTITQIIIGVSLAQILSAFPIATLGTFGTYEAGWTLGFMFAGIGFDDASVTAIATQFITLLFACFLAVPYWFINQHTVHKEK